MQKTFCDICKDEVSPQTYAGGIMRNTDVHQIVPVSPSGNLRGEEDRGVIRKKVIQEVWDLCETCQKWVWNLAEEKIKELKKIKDLTKSLKP